MTGVTVGIAITILSWHFEDDERTREWEIDWRLIDKGDVQDNEWASVHFKRLNMLYTYLLNKLII